MQDTDGAPTRVWLGDRSAGDQRAVARRPKKVKSAAWGEPSRQRLLGEIG